MNIKKLLILISFLLSLCSVYAADYDFTVGNLCYKISDETNKEVLVEGTIDAFGRTGTLSNTSITIPASVYYNSKYYTVVGSVIYATWQGSKVESVSIPATFKFDTNQENAFLYNTPNLKSITVDNANTDLIVQDGILYSKDLTVLIHCPSLFKPTSFPRTVEKIYYGAFNYNSVIESLNFIFVKEVGTQAFAFATNLKKVTFTSSLTSLNRLAFDHCTSLSSLSLGSIKVIGEYNNNGFLLSPFQNCQSLKTLTLSSVVEAASLSGISSDAVVKCFNPKGIKGDFYGAKLIVPYGSTTFFRKKGYIGEYTEVEIEEMKDGITMDNVQTQAGTTISVPLSVDPTYYQPEYNGYNRIMGDIELPDGFTIKNIIPNSSIKNFSYTLTEQSTKNNFYLSTSESSTFTLNTITQDFITLEIEISPNVTFGDKYIFFDAFQLFNQTEYNGYINVYSPSVGLVKIVEPLISQISLTPSEESIKVGESTTITATVTPENLTNKSLEWSAIPADLVELNTNGLTASVVGKNIGKVTIQAAATDGSGVVGEATINVIPTPVSSITLSPSNKTIFVEETFNLIATVSPDDATDKTVTYSSSPNGIVSVTGNTVKGLKSGKATITATAGSQSATCEVTVVEAPEFMMEGFEIRPGESKEIPVRLQIDEDAKDMFEYSAFSFTAVCPEGLTITDAKLNSDLTSKGFTIPRLVAGKEVMVYAQGTGANPSKTLDSFVTLTVSADENAQPTENAQLILSGCMVVLPSSTELESDDVSVSVKILEVPVSAITIEADYEDRCTHDDLREGEKMYFTANVAPANATNKTVNWSVEDSSIASITEDGVLTALNAGTTKVIATVAETPSVSKEFELTILEGTQGDSNDNGSVNIADVVAIRNEVLKNEQSENTSFCHSNADIDSNDKIEVIDQAAVLNYVLTGSFDTTSNGTRAASVITGCLTADNFDSHEGMAEIGISLDNPADFIILQADIIIPEGMKVEEIKAGKQAVNHMISYNYIEENVLRIVIDSPYNQSFSNTHGALFSLSVSMDPNCGDLQICNIVAANKYINRHELSFGGGFDNGSTSVTMESEDSLKVMTIQGGITILTGQSKNISIYSLDGKLIKSINLVNDTETIYLAPGIYAVVCDNQSLKVMVK